MYDGSKWDIKPYEIVNYDFTGVFSGATSPASTTNSSQAGVDGLWKLAANNATLGTGQLGTVGNTSQANGRWALSQTATSGRAGILFLGAGIGGENPNGVGWISCVDFHSADFWITIGDTTNAAYYIGLMSNCNQVLATSGNGMFFRADSSISSGQWTAFSGTGGASSNTGTGTAMNTNRVKLSIRKFSSSSLVFYINNVQYGSPITTNIPHTSAFVTPWFWSQTNVTAGPVKQLIIDKCIVRTNQI
jgi:hypothetical protein